MAVFWRTRKNSRTGSGWIRRFISRGGCPGKKRWTCIAGTTFSFFPACTIPADSPCWRRWPTACRSSVWIAAGRRSRWATVAGFAFHCSRGTRSSRRLPMRFIFTIRSARPSVNTVSRPRVLPLPITTGIARAKKWRRFMIVPVRKRVRWQALPGARFPASRDACS